MLKIIILLFFINFIFPQNIYHEPIESIQNGYPIEIDVFTDLQGQEIINYNLFYKNNIRQHILDCLLRVKTIFIILLLFLQIL